MTERNRVIAHDDRQQRKLRYTELDDEALTEQVVAAILTHRSLVEADQVVYSDWMTACDSPGVSATVVRALQEEYVLRQQKTLAQQAELEDMLDVLGFIPEVE